MLPQRLHALDRAPSAGRLRTGHDHTASSFLHCLASQQARRKLLTTGNDPARPYECAQRVSDGRLTDVSSPVKAVIPPGQHLAGDAPDA